MTTAAAVNLPIIDLSSSDSISSANSISQIMAWSHSLHPMEFLDFRSTLHRVMPAGQERYSVALFMSPNEDCVVECLKSCCSEESPPRFPPVRSGDYLEERFRLTHAT